MQCRICGVETNDIDSGDDYEEYACPDCGPYKVTRTAIATMDNHGVRLDVALTRRWLSQQTPEFIPTIDSELAMRLSTT